MTKRSLVCIACPMGCHLEVTRDSGGLLQVSGNRCPKGLDYAVEEINSPKRIVTTTVALSTECASLTRVPVRTDKPLPMEHIPTVLTALHALTLTPPVHKGDLLIEDFQQTGVNVIASLTADKA